MKISKEKKLPSSNSKRCLYYLYEKDKIIKDNKSDEENSEFSDLIDLSEFSDSDYDTQTDYDYEDYLDRTDESFLDDENLYKFCKKRDLNQIIGNVESRNYNIKMNINIFECNVEQFKEISKKKSIWDRIHICFKKIKKII